MSDKADTAITRNGRIEKSTFLSFVPSKKPIRITAETIALFRKSEWKRSVGSAPEKRTTPAATPSPTVISAKIGLDILISPAVSGKVKA